MGVLRNQKNEKTFVDLTENDIKSKGTTVARPPASINLNLEVRACPATLKHERLIYLIMVKSGSNHCQVVTGTIKHLLLHQYDNTVLLLTCSSLIQTRVAQIHINGLILRKLNRLIFFSLPCCLVFLCHYWCDCFS